MRGSRPKSISPTHRAVAFLRRGAWAGLLASSILLTSGTAPAEQEDKAAEEATKLEKLEQEIEAARQAQTAREAERAQLEQETLALQDTLIETAIRIRTQEDALSEAETRLTDLISEEQRIAYELSKRRAELATLLGAMQMFERQKPPALLVSPDDAVTAVRSAILLNEIVPKFVDESRTIEARLNELQSLRRNIISEQAHIAVGEADLEEEQTRIEALLTEKEAKKKRLSSDLVQEQERITQLGREASSLQMLIARLITPPARIVPRAKPGVSVVFGPFARKTSEPLPPKLVLPERRERLKFTEARGTLQLPVSGNILITYGAPNRRGEISMGLTIEAREHAQVVAPFDGKIVYAGAFLDYGQLLLIEAGEGYHILFTGMARIYGQVGDRLLAGEPVGVMGEARAAAPNGERRAPQLYFEFRKDGEPINPVPWLAANERKASG